ncbi:hypothetical protein, partial [Methylicorpusculum sp.]|uniref:hypothetical protein n=1 Tax=Methylicorpusculum sp. TaxID=2713644 RepID=UPI0027262E59
KKNTINYQQVTNIKQLSSHKGFGESSTTNYIITCCFLYDKRLSFRHYLVKAGHAHSVAGMARFYDTAYRYIAMDLIFRLWVVSKYLSLL